MNNWFIHRTTGDIHVDIALSTLTLRFAHPQYPRVDRGDNGVMQGVDKRAPGWYLL